MTAAALAPLFSNPTTISGIAHTRHQECDRIEAMKDGLIRIGQGVRDTESSIEIAPMRLEPATIDTYEDHRIAMSFAILGSRDITGQGESWLKIMDPLCCRKTFPDFFDELALARETSLQAANR